MTSRTTTAAIAAAGVALVTPVALTAPVADASTVRANVIRVLDGETVRVKVGGAARSVRLLGVDAPERADCFGTEAAAALRRMLPRGAAVRLIKDGRRRGVYIRSAGKLVNQAMLAGGFATADRVARLRKGNRLGAAAERAEGAGRGLWGACDESPAPATGAPAPPAATPARDQLTSALAGGVLRRFDNSTGGCETGCFQREESLEYCGDGSFAYDFQSVVQLPTALVPPEVRHEEGTWQVRDATAEPDGTLSGTVEVTLLRGTAIDSGEAAPGTVETQSIAIAPDGTTLVGGERWFREASERCA